VKKLEIHWGILASLLLMVTIVSLPLLLRDQSPPLAKNGFLDLSNWNWEKDGPVPLGGEWKFQNSEDRSEFLSPEYDDSSWDIYSSTKSASGLELVDLGVSYYRLKVRADSPDKMGLYMEKIFSSYDLYINGEKVLTAGNTSADEDENIPQILPLMSEIYWDQEFTIVIRIVNYYNKWGDLVTLPRIGLYDDLTREHFISTAIDLIVLGCFIFTGLYHLFLWIRWRRNKTNLFFALLCFISSFYLISFGNHIYQLFPDLSAAVFHLTIKIQYLSITLLPVVLAQFFHSLFPKDFHIKIIRFFQIMALFFIIYIFITEISVYSRILYFHIFISTAQFFWISVSLVMATYRKRENAQAILIGFFMINATTLNDLFGQFNIIPTSILLPVAIALFIIIQSNILSRIFIQEFIESEKLGKRLSKEVQKKRKTLNLQNNRLQEALEELKNEEIYKNNFFKNISNKLRIPLSEILEDLASIEKEFGDQISDRVGQLMTIVRKNSHHLYFLLEQLIELTQIEKGKNSLEITGNNIIPFIKDIQSCFDSGKVLFSYPESDYYKYFFFDSDKMDKVLRNLISNGLKFSGNQPVTIRTEINPIEKQDSTHFGLLKIMVKDSGPGIPEEKRNRIFDRFYQLDQGKIKEKEGLGIGLSLVKEYVAMHDGSIEIHSDDSGSEFILSLPLKHRDIDLKARDKIRNKKKEPVLHAKESSEASEESPVFDTADIGKKSMLVLEDNDDLRNYLSLHLQDEFNLHKAKDGLEGLDILRCYPIDIIIADIMMPRMNGIEFREAILKEEINHSIPFLFLTAKAEINDQVKGLQQGAVDYITKPFDMKELLYKVRTLLQLKDLSEKQISDRIKHKLSSYFNRENKEEFRQLEVDKKCREYQISSRERDVLDLLLQGLKNNEISEKLHISPATVKNHVSSILSKCNVKKRTGLINLFT